MIKMKLEEIADIFIGILAKREKEEKGENSYKLFSLKNYEEKQEFEELRTNKDLNNSLSRKGDLLFKLLCPNKIIYVEENMQGLLIPSQFCIIRTKKMIPIVLKWYLESKKVKDELEVKASGSIMKSIRVSSIKEINIPIIPIEQQKNMEELIKLWEKERELSKNILEQKEKLYNFYLEKMLEKGENNG